MNQKAHRAYEVVI